MRTRPFLPIALAFITGLHFAFRIPVAGETVVLLVAGLLLAALVFQRYAGIATLCLLAAMPGLGVLTHRLAHEAAVPDEVRTLEPYQTIEVIATVTTVPEERFGRVRFQALVHALRVDSLLQPVRFRIRVQAPEVAVEPGDEIFLRAGWLPPRGPRNLGTIDMREQFAAAGLAGTVRVRTDGVVLKTGVNHYAEVTFSARAGRVRSVLNTAVHRALPQSSAGIVAGLLLGERGGIEEDILHDFSSAGIIHVLAVSGLHVGFIMLIIYIAGSFFNLPRSALLVISLLGVWAFALVTGMKPPVFRASLMATLFVIAMIRDKRADALNLLSFAALVILALRPGDLYSVGFQLSFAAVAGIVLLHPFFEQRIRKISLIDRAYAHALPRWTLSLMIVSLSAQLGTLPVSAWHFGSFSLVGMLANLFAIPLVFVAVATAFVMLIASAFWPGAAAVFAATVHVVITLVVELAAVMARLPFAAVEGWYPDFPLIVLYGLVLFWLLAGSGRIRFYTLLAMLLVLNFRVWAPVLSGSARLLEVAVLDVGQGDAIVVRSPTGRAMLIDAGPAFADVSAGERHVVPFLQRQGIRQLDVVVVTHPHLDHFGGLFAVAETIPLGKVVFADTGYASPVFRNLLSFLNFRNVPIQIARRGDLLDELDPVLGMILAPPEDLAVLDKHLNNASIVLKLMYGRTAFLFTGDAEERAERRVSGYGGFLRAAVLKAGHHGSRTSSTPAFLSRAQPEIAVFSAGAFNKYGHPDPGILARYRAVGASIHRTDLQGAALFRSDGDKIRRIIALPLR